VSIPEHELKKPPLRWCAIAIAATLIAGEALLFAAPAAARSLSGAYLAARQAAQRNDLNAASKYFAAALAMNPQDNMLRAQAMNFAVMSGDLERATIIARALADDDPSNQMSVIMLTVDDIAANRLESARSRMNDNLEAFTPLLSKLLSGWIAYGLGDLAGAESALNGLDDNTLFSMFGKYHLGLALAASGEHERADGYFNEAATLANRRTSRLTRAHGATLEALGRPEEARALYDQLLAQNLGDQVVTSTLTGLNAGVSAQPIVKSAQDGAAEVMLDLADGLAQSPNLGLALVYAQLAAFLRPDLDEAKLLIADLFQAQEQYELAIESFAEVRRGSPHFVAAEIGRSDALRNMERADDALAVLKALTGEFPEVVQAHVALGDLLRSEEQFEASVKAYSAAIERLGAPDERNWALFYQRGVAFERSGRWDEAEADFRKALELAPDQPLVLNYLGYSLVEKRRSLEEAQAMIERAVEQRPDDGYITDSLGWVLYRLGKYEEAVPQMELAVELMPVDPIINDHLGDVLWKVGRKLEAAFQWKRALSFDPEPEDATRIREKLARGLDAVLEDEAAEAASTEQKTNGG
jgi:tetratricopeptide (TPR) repeat protein